MTPEDENIKVSLGRMCQKLDAMHSDIKDIKEWQRGHDGQGEGTTHGIIDRRLSSHSMWINIFRGMGLLLAALWAWLSSKINWLDQG